MLSEAKHPLPVPADSSSAAQNDKEPVGRLASPLPGVHIPTRVIFGLAIVAAVTIFTVLPAGFVFIGSFNTAGTGQAWS